MSGILLAILAAAFIPAPAQAADVPPAAPAQPEDERKVPDPRLPLIEDLPPGFAPEAWTTWSTGQSVDYLTRIEIGLSGGSGFVGGTRAGSWPEAPNHDEFSDIEFGLFLQAGYSLTPALAIIADFGAFKKSETDIVVPYAGSPTLFDMAVGPSFSLILSIRFTLPLAHIGEGLFRFSQAEAPTGFALYVEAGGGLAFIGDVRMYNTYGMGGEFQYWNTTTNPSYGVGGGISFRWVNFGFFAEICMVGMGRPEASDDPNWNGANQAQRLTATFIRGGLAFHF